MDTKPDSTEQDETYLTLSGLKVTTDQGTFYFSEPGNWIYNTGWPDQGKLHRVDGPAAITTAGNLHWFRNGLRHRADGPAVIKVDGTQRWYINGELVNPFSTESSDQQKLNGKPLDTEQ